MWKVFTNLTRRKITEENVSEIYDLRMFPKMFSS